MEPGERGGRWRAFEHDKLVKRDKLNLDRLWLRDSALEDSENLPEPEVLAAEIVEDRHAALEAFQAIARESEPSGDDMARSEAPRDNRTNRAAGADAWDASTPCAKGDHRGDDRRVLLYITHCFPCI